MENNAENIICNDLIHIVCLPFNITKGENQPPDSMDEVAKTLGAPWKERATPDNEEPWGKFRDYQARAYFHPFVRRFLHDEKRVRRFHRTDVPQIKVDLGHWSTGAFSILANVSRCELILFQPDIGVLLLEISPQAPLNLRQTQLLLDSFRRLYPPYVDHFCKDNHSTWFGGHCPIAVTLLDKQGKAIGSSGNFRGETPEFMRTYKEALLADPPDQRPRYPWAGHWQTLLHPFDCACIQPTGFRAQQLGDDRAPIFSWVAFEDPRAVDRGNWMRLCFADAPGTDCLPYAHAFTGNFEEKYCYDRYWYEPGESGDAPSRILNCGYAFCFAGKSNDPGFFTNTDNGAHATFRHIYVEMGLIAHFQKAALLAMSQRLSELVDRKDGMIELPKSDKVRDFYDHFVEFTQNFWFDEISPQVQGQELFQKWRDHLCLQKLYEEVRQELKDLVDYSELRATGDLNRNLGLIAIAGFILAFLSLFTGIFGMNDPGKDMDWLPARFQLFGLSPQIIANSGLGFALVCLAGAVAYGLFRLVGYFKRKRF